MVSRGLFYFVTAILLCLGILLVAYQKYFIKKNVKSPLKQGIL